MNNNKIAKDLKDFKRKNDIIFDSKIVGSMLKDGFNLREILLKNPL